MDDLKLSQKILDVMFECISRIHARDHVPEDRDECMDWVRDQLCKCLDVEVVPMGISHGVLRVRKDEAFDALSFVLSDFEFLHAGQMDRMARVKHFMDLVGLKVVKR